MVRRVMREVWKTEGGSEFNTEAEAARAEAVEGITNLFENMEYGGIKYYKEDDVAEFIVCHADEFLSLLKMVPDS